MVPFRLNSSLRVYVGRKDKKMNMINLNQMLIVLASPVLAAARCRWPLEPRGVSLQPLHYQITSAQKVLSICQAK
jgi:hypothetical protein